MIPVCSISTAPVTDVDELIFGRDETVISSER